MRGDHFNQEQATSFGLMNHYIRQLIVAGNFDTNFAKSRMINQQVLRCCVTEVKESCIGSEAWRKFFDDRSL